jgi:aspartyl-tRNA(Asn)/glutamyl-tRNA(Gln) amidotransferase subunit C
MTEQITPDIFSHLVDLAALDLTPEQGDYLRRELNNQLKAIHELESIPLDADVPISLHGVPFPLDICPPLRADEWVPCADAELIIGQAPLSADGYIVVPDIPHTTLD